MPAHDPSHRVYLSQIAAGRRWGTDTTEAQQALKLSRAQDYVQRLITEAPPLTAEQRDHLVLLLRGGPSQSGGAPPGRHVGLQGTADPPSAVSTERGDTHALGGDAA